MSLRFPYQPATSATASGPIHPSGAFQFLRPFVPIRIIGPQTSFGFSRALVDPGSIDSIFPLDVVPSIGATLLPATRHILRWRGTAYPLRFGHVELQMTGSGTLWMWSTLVGFSTAPIPYVLLGHFGFLEYVDASFRGGQHLLDLETSSRFPGTVTQVP